MKDCYFVENFIEEHKQEDWITLLTQPPYNLIKSEDEDYILFKYRQIPVEDGGSDFNEEIVRECRGIIIDKHTLKVVALSFKKFWNIQEPLAENIDWKHCQVQEKIDGSKILCWYNTYKNRWQFSTSGILDAFQAQVNGFGKTFGQLVEDAITSRVSMSEFTDNLYCNMCYTFELVSPDNRVVVPYKETELYFIGARDIYTFREYDIRSEKVDSIELLRTTFKIPLTYSLNSLEDCIKATEKMGTDQEGFVVVDNNWKRVKIKSPAYVAAHYLRSNNVTSYARVLSLIEDNKHTEFLSIFPEYKEIFDKVVNYITSFKEDLFKAILELQIIKLKDSVNIPLLLDRKWYAEWIQKNYPQYRSFLFKYLDTDLINMFIDNEWGKLTANGKLKYLNLKEEIDADEFKEE